MNRMNWINFMKILFDELETFTGAKGKQKHVELGNFVKALKKIKNMLPLQAKLEYIKNCGEVCFSYKEVENGLQNTELKYISWDHVIDMFLSRQSATTTNPP